MYSRNVIDVDWGVVVKFALPEKVTRRAYKVFGIYDRSSVLSHLEFYNSHLKPFYNIAFENVSSFQLDISFLKYFLISHGHSLFIIIFIIKVYLIYYI
jgi:hypothetical protein